MAEDVSVTVPRMDPVTSAFNLNGDASPKQTISNQSQDLCFFTI